MKIAVLGAGPIGLEAAIEAEARGHQVVVYEAGRVGEHVRRWGHVTLFTPWRMAVTEQGAARVELRLDDPEAFPTGAELADRYLSPLAATLDVREGQRVQAVGRTTRRKGHDIGSSARATEPFRLVLRGGDGEHVEHADAVLDCTGVFGDPAPAGAGGLSAPGEADAAAQGQVLYGPVDVSGLAGRPVLLAGDGASAVSVLSALLSLEPVPQVVWVTPRDTVPGFVSPDDDVLPARRGLYQLGRAAPDHPAVRHRGGALIDRMCADADGVWVHLTDGSEERVGTVISCTGFRPDHALARELQLHVCYASEGPMKLAAGLLAASGAGGDCLSQPEQGANTLVNPEPRFFVLGNKSYGRRSDFLLKIGHKQVQDALNLLTDCR